MSHAKIAHVALFTPPFQTLSYLVPDYLPEEAWQVAQRVAVPLGNSLRAGLVLGFSPVPESTEFILKPLLWPLERKPLLPVWYCELAVQTGIRHTAEPGQILANILPAGLRSANQAVRVWEQGRKPKDIRLRAMRSMAHAELQLLGEQWTQGLADCSELPVRQNEVCLLEKDPPWPVRPAATSQTAILEYLHETGPVGRKRLLAALGEKVQASLSTLVKKGLVSIRPDKFGGMDDCEEGIAHIPSPPAAMDFTLTDQQSQVVSSLGDALERSVAGRTETHLLFGVTGSGKTAVYLELAQKTLERGLSVLLLAPEVALAHKLRNDVRAALPDAPLSLYHGYLTPATRERVFRSMVETAPPRIIVGTRSALFLPHNGLGLIILDEEHDASFKQDEHLSYQAKEVAWYRAGVHNALLVLGSATPDVKSFYASEQGHIPRHDLPDRVGGGSLPEIRLLPLPRQTQRLLVDESLDTLRETVKAGEQAVILLNRRGYAPLMYCLGCGEVARCPSCDIGLTYHKGRERLVCHYCGYSVPFPSPCALCKSLHFLPMGEGTEKLEETLATSLPPGAGILRLDRDSTRRQGSMEDILATFARKEAQVLVGTQMLSKGHHFPDVTLAVVADADLGLNMPDYRAAERTFQLLVQSSGRSGRGVKKGQVIIQTRNPAHYCWEFVRNADYAGFYEKELALRQKRRYPPFVKLALIRISFGMDEPDAADAMPALTSIIRSKGMAMGLTVLGPAPAPLPFLRGRKRFHCLVKGDSWQDLRELFQQARQAAAKTTLRVTLDVDPVNML